MAKSYQLVTWTDKGQVRMLPSEVNALIHGSLAKIDRLIDSIRFGTRFEVPDILNVCSAYEQLGARLLNLGRIEDAFLQFAQSAECCCNYGNNWVDYEVYENFCKPLRGRFFAMYGQCRNLVRRYPRLCYTWSKTCLTKYQGWLNEKSEWLLSEYA